jgi:transcriptional regulator with XRE-family HTH domain
MRTPRTTIAQLRAIIGLRAKELADVLGCSVPTINSIETGRLKLSEAMAKRMVHETGISLAWLLNGDVSAPPIAEWGGEPFTAETFEWRQANKVHWDRVSEFELTGEFLIFAGRLRSIVQDAQRRKDVAMTFYKIGRFLGTLPGGRADTEAESARWLRHVRLIESDIALIDRENAAMAAGLGFPYPRKTTTKKGAPAKARPRSLKRKG